MIYHVHRGTGRLEVDEIPSWLRTSVNNCWWCVSASAARRDAVERLLQGARMGCFLCQDCKDKLFW